MDKEISKSHNGNDMNLDKESLEKFNSCIHESLYYLTNSYNLKRNLQFILRTKNIINEGIYLVMKRYLIIFKAN